MSWADYVVYGDVLAESFAEARREGPTVRKATQEDIDRLMG